MIEGIAGEDLEMGDPVTIIDGEVCKINWGNIKKLLPDYSYGLKVDMNTGNYTLVGGNR